jgi:predicted dehydrogenase
VHEYASEDSAAALLEFDSGVIGAVDTFFCIPDAASRNRLELYGSEGSLLSEGTIGQGAEGTLIACRQDTGGGYDAQQVRRADGVEITPEPVNTYAAEVQAFGQAVLEGRKPPVDGLAGLHSARVLAACYASARSGKMERVG